MENSAEMIKSKVSLLKESRLQLLRLHKLLVDAERKKYEDVNGQVSSGHFLNLLVGDPNFEWLRKFSTLIVEIDEMLDLDDGYTENMIDKYISQMRGLLALETSDAEFIKKYENALQTDAEIFAKHNELKKMLDE